MQFEKKILRLNNFREVMRDNEHFYSVNKTWSLSQNLLDYRQSVMETFQPIIKEMVTKIKERTTNVELPSG